VQDSELYIADYSLLADIPTIHRDADQRYVAAPLVLFVVRDPGVDLIPIAIQLGQTPAPDNPVGIRQTGPDPENELGGGQFRGSGARTSPPGGVQERSPGRGSAGLSPPEADDFSQLKGYLDVLWRDLVTSGIL